MCGKAFFEGVLAWDLEVNYDGNKWNDGKKVSFAKFLLMVLKNGSMFNSSGKYQKYMYWTSSPRASAGMSFNKMSHPFGLKGDSKDFI